MIWEALPRCKTSFADVWIGSERRHHVALGTVLLQRFCPACFRTELSCTRADGACGCVVARQQEEKHCDSCRITEAALSPTVNLPLMRVLHSSTALSGMIGRPMNPREGPRPPAAPAMFGLTRGSPVRLIFACVS
jgi:hypothetical protein